MPTIMGGGGMGGGADGSEAPLIKSERPDTPEKAEDGPGGMIEQMVGLARKTPDDTPYGLRINVANLSHPGVTTVVGRMAKARFS